MCDPDLQFAIALQTQLNSDLTNKELARELQNEFSHEFETENAVGLVYHNKKKNRNDSRSLVDPSWELVDPTPNIHHLFIVFNERFFWSKLVAVCVSWSKRMTSCAGICSYRPRAGLCSITLSEPLLKLRPRKDLVETLLHEMIHAYLFVTHNNRDRDGHGPEFHKHMYRINNEAGTNITVYHDFHDEVRLYKQHWWRCNGPCQKRQPYYGIVKRAMNRAPGPNDFWWKEHQTTCSGTFIKIREPEKPEKSNTSVKGTIKQDNTKSLGDITKYITSKGNATTVSNNSTINKSKSDDAVGRINNNASSAKIAPVFNKENIHGFSNMGGKSNNSMGVKTKSNTSSTVVVTNNKVPSNKQTETKKSPEAFSGTGRTITSTTSSNNVDYETVRNHWINKFENTTPKRPSNDPVTNNSKKIKASSNNVIILDDENINCPICNKPFKESQLNNHLDVCLNETDFKTQDEPQDVRQTCYVCNKSVLQTEYKTHVSQCFDNKFDDEDDFNNLKECPICNVYFKETAIEEHTRRCVEKAFSSQGSELSLSQCSVCSEFVDNDKIDKHTEECLHKLMDEVEEKYNLEKTNENVRCLVCNNKIGKDELTTHLEVCIGDVFEKDFEETVVGQSDIDKPSCSKSVDVKKFECPVCMKKYTESDLNVHINECLLTNESDDITKLKDSFTGDDFQFDL